MASYGWGSKLQRPGLGGGVGGRFVSPIPTVFSSCARLHCSCSSSPSSSTCRLLHQSIQSPECCFLFGDAHRQKKNAHIQSDKNDFCSCSDSDGTVGQLRNDCAALLMSALLHHGEQVHVSDCVLHQMSTLPKLQYFFYKSQVGGICFCSARLRLGGWGV